MLRKKKWVQTSTEDCKKYVMFRDIHGANYLFENGVALSIPCIFPFDIDGATQYSEPCTFNPEFKKNGGGGIGGEGAAPSPPKQNDNTSPKTVML